METCEARVSPYTRQNRKIPIAGISLGHKDQVTKLPADEIAACPSRSCKYDAIPYGDTACTIQPHPEFTEGFAVDLVEARHDALPERAASDAARSLENDISATGVAEVITGFFRGARRHIPNHLS